MEFSNLWEGRTGRLPYLAVLIISSAAIAVLPFITGKIIMAYAAGMDPALSILRSLLSTLFLGIGFLITGVPLVFLARRRMRELGLSGVWLLLFPIAPLQTLLAFAVASTSQVIWPLAIASPVTALFCFEFAFGALLAVLPSGDYLEHSPKRFLRLAHGATTCEGRLNRQTFALRLAIALGLTILIEAIDTFGPVGGLTRHGEHSVSSLAGTATFASGLLTIFIMMFVTSTTIRRLHDLNWRGWWIVLFPLGLPSLAAAFVFLANPLLLTTLMFNPFILFSSVQGVGCLVVLVWLLLKRSSDFNNRYGQAVDRPNGRYAPA